MNLTRKSWGGWNPANDEINGAVDQLVRLDNLTQDKDGSLTLTKGTKVVSGPYPDYPVALYSTMQLGRKFRYTALRNGSVYRQDTNNTTNSELSYDGNPLGSGNYCVFGAGWGETLICTPGKRWKDNITELRPLGLHTPNDSPNVEPSAQQSMYVVESFQLWTMEEGNFWEWGLDYSERTGYMQAETETVSNAASTAPNRIVMQLASNSLIASYIDINTLSYGGDTYEQNLDDTFTMSVRLSESQALDTARIEFWLDEIPSTGSTLAEGGSNYFYKEWQNDIDSPFNQGINIWSNISSRRGDFVREGTDNTKGWDHIKGIRIIFNGLDALTVVVTDLKFVGGPKGTLNGVYQYVAVYAYNSGKYVSVGPMGPPSNAFQMTNGYFDIIPPAPPYYASSGCEIWIYRRSVYTKEFERFPLGLLDKWHRVLIFTQPEWEGSDQTKEDNMSDIEALKMPVLNEWLMSVKDLPEDVYGVLGPVYDRILYMSMYSVYIGESLSPDSVDTRYTLKLSGSSGEKNLFFCKLSEGVILIATTHDFYLITGDFTPMPDGTLNISIKAIGEGHPAISDNYAAESGTIVYMASDGWRTTNGSYSELISVGLSPLFNKETVFEFPPIALAADNWNEYPCTIGQGRIFTSVPLTDGRRLCCVYHIIKKYWYVWLTDPVVLYTEEDGTILGGYSWWEDKTNNTGGNPCVRELYVGTLLDETGGQDVLFRTTKDDNQQPRNRKETFTFKITMDTGNVAVDLYIAKDSNSFTYLGAYAFNGIQEKVIDIAQTVGIGFRFAIMIKGTKLAVCRLINYTIEYDAYPEQLTSLRIPYDNLGTPSRKRIVNFPIVINCLGNSTTLTPYIDGVASPLSTLSLDRKGTHIHYFTTETVGVDIGGYLTGGPFEYYGLNLGEIVSEKMPVPVKYLVIPPNDYGNPNRKRHSSYKFQINTRGYQVRFTPIMDGVSYSLLNFSTDTKKTQQYYFQGDAVGIDIGGILETTEDEEFEFYGVIVPQHLEILPDMLKYRWVPENNFGLAAPKRIRTLPLVINTNGYDVQFTPYVDKVAGTPSTLNTPSKQTAFHYFATDVFGTDFAGEFLGSEWFEFYEMLKPEEVELLPVAKRFDQIGPFRFDSIGKLLAIRLRLIPTATESLQIKVLSETESTYPNSTAAAGVYSVFQKVIGGVDDVYEIHFPKTIMGTIFRFEIGPTTNPFHRYDLQIRVNVSGKDQVAKWVSLNANNS